MGFDCDLSIEEITIDLLKLYLSLEKAVFEIFGNVLVYYMFENTIYCSGNSSYCNKIKFSSYSNEPTDFACKL